VAALGMLLALAAGAEAHRRSVSYSTWTPGPEGARIELRLAALDVTMIGRDPWTEAEAVAAWAVERLRATREGRPCTAVRPPVTSSADGFLTVVWEVTCAGPPDAIESRLFADVAPTHLHFARVGAAGDAVAERVLTADDARFALSSGAGSPAIGSSFGDYVLLGVEHIATGYDHLAFVLALLLLAGSLAEVATIVTAFTVAHSVTLAAAVLGLVRTEPVAVEALIGFSIALVAVENAWLLGGRDRATPWLVAAALAVAAAIPGAIGTATLAGLALFSLCHLGLLAQSRRPERLRAAVAFGFGLIHGFGFAGILAELELPRARLAAALVGFNAGVELGQLAVVALGWTALLAVEHTAPGARRRVAELGSAAICALGVAWFVTRGWG
jgi:hypothetical protein